MQKKRVVSLILVAAIVLVLVMGSVSAFNLVDFIKGLFGAKPSLSPPSITLTSPANGFSLYNNSAFALSASLSSNVGLRSAIFYVWNSTGSVIQEYSFAPSGSSASLNTGNLPRIYRAGLYHWNVKVTDIQGTTAFAPSNYTIDISAPPSITLISPSNGFSISNTSTTFFNSTLSSSVGIASVSLYLWNSAGTEILSYAFSPTYGVKSYNAKTTNLLMRFPAGLYHWNVKVIDTKGNIAFSPSNYTLNIFSSSALAINLLYPNDGFSVLNTSTTFFNSTLYSSVGIASVSLYLWNSAGTEILSYAFSPAYGVTSYTAKTSNLYMRFPAGLYHWNVKLTDTNGGNSFAPSNNTLNILSPTPFPCTESDWISTLSPSTCPSFGSQTKTWTKIGTCTGGVTHPTSETISCTPITVSTGVCSCNSCGTCNTALSNQSCSTVLLTQEIGSTTSSGCINFTGQFRNSKVLDCQNNVINTPTSTGVYLSGFNNTVRNCNIFSYLTGTIISLGSNANKLIDSSLCHGTSFDLVNYGLNAVVQNVACQISYPAGICSASCITAGSPPCTESDWIFSVTPSICPSTGNQTKIWYKIGQCTNGVTHPSSEVISCSYSTPICTSFTVSEWGVCTQSGTQSRTITSSSPTGCAGGSPILSQPCLYVPPCTDSDWSYTISPSACPSSGSQTRTWSQIGQCLGGLTHPAIETISCSYSTPTCTSFTFSDWGVCTQSGTQSRTITSSSPTGCAGGSPITSQSCIYTASCTESDWSATLTPSTCPSSGSQTRTWDQIGSCTGGVTHQTETITCSPSAPTCQFNYTEWGVCTQSGTQSRSITAIFPAGCTSSNPITSQTCTYLDSCTESNWQSDLSPSTCPVDGNRTRTWTKVGTCAGGVNHPASENASCSPGAGTTTCTSFAYSDYGSCLSSGVKTRVVLSSSPSGCTGGSPVTSIGCEYIADTGSTGVDSTTDTGTDQTGTDEGTTDSATKKSTTVLIIILSIIALIVAVVIAIVYFYIKKSKKTGTNLFSTK